MNNNLKYSLSSFDANSSANLSTKSIAENENENENNPSSQNRITLKEVARQINAATEPLRDN